MDSVAKNKPSWPPESDAPRIRRYSQGYQVYTGQHEAVYVKGKDFKYAYDASRDYVSVNLLGTLTDLISDRLFGEGIDVAAPDEQPGTNEFFAHLYERNDLDHVLLDAAKGASYRGDACLKARYDEEELRIVIESFSPALYFPEVDPLNAKRVTAINIGQVIGAGEQYHLWIERHEFREGRGWVVNKLYRLSGSRDEGFRVDFRDDEVALESLPLFEAMREEYETGIDDLLVVHVPNMTTEESGIWGIWDYGDLINIQGELNNRRTQWAEILDKHADPVMYGPALANEKGQVVLADNKYIPYEGDTTPVGYVTWDGQLGAAQEEIRSLTEALAVTGGTEVGTLLAQYGQGLSGKALRMMQLRTQSTVQAKQRAWSPALRRLFSTTSKLAVAPGVKLAWKPQTGSIMAVEPDQVRIGWNDGLPTDALEDAELYDRLVASQLLSRESAIAAQHPDWSAKEVAAELERITQEQGAGAPAAEPFTVPNFGALAETGV